jgi:threonine dehydrogenase-like Zn-dependent dehydrogenase
MESTATEQAAYRHDPRTAHVEPEHGHMRAAVLTAPGRFELQEAELPEPGPRQVRIRLQGCGVCASNIPAFEGREWFSYPMGAGDLGHEGWGIVDALGEEVTEVEVGDRVAALSFNAYAEYDVADAEAVVKLPRALDRKPFPGEALGCAMNIFRRAQIEPGQTVAIIGIGFLGGALTQLATRAGARVIAVSRSASALALARLMGAAEVVPMHDHWEIIERVKKLTNEEFCPRVIECTGKQWPLDLAAELTAFGGRMVVAGFHQDGPRQVNMQLWNWRGIDVISAHERDQKVAVRGMREAVEAVASGRFDPTPLFTHRFPLSELDQALEACKNRPEGFTKALVTMEGRGGNG